MLKKLGPLAANMIYTQKISDAQKLARELFVSLVHGQTLKKMIIIYNLIAFVHWSGPRVSFVGWGRIYLTSYLKYEPLIF